MLKFNIENLRSVYVYILKVTTDYVYVTTTRTGAPYRLNSSVQDTHNGYNISKIRIHRSVSTAYSTFYATREFAKPRLASLNFYDDDVVSIEIQMVNKWVGGYQNSDNWQSFFSSVVSRLETKLKDIDQAWINGTEIFWLKPEIEDDEQVNKDKVLATDNNGSWVSNNGRLTRRFSTEFMLDVDGFLSIRAVNFVRLGSMGLSILAALNNKKEIEASNGIGDATLNEIVNRANLKVEDGKVLTYYPHGSDLTQERIAVFSPVLQQKKLNDSFKSASKEDYTPDEEQKVYHLTSNQNPAHANIDFAIKAARTVGKLYGYEETDDLDIQRIIEQTGQVNLMNIDENSRRTMPIHMTAMSCLAYVFRFIHRETDLNKMRDLSTMFRFCINKGLVYESDINSNFKEDAPEQHIPLLTHRTEQENRDLLSQVFGNGVEMDSANSDTIKKTA
jgi:hypothetical protein